MGALLLIVLVMVAASAAAYALLMWAFGPRGAANPRPHAQRHGIAYGVDEANRYYGECETAGCSFEAAGFATLDGLVAAHAAFEAADYAQRLLLDSIRPNCQEAGCPKDAEAEGYCGAHHAAHQRSLARAA